MPAHARYANAIMADVEGVGNILVSEKSTNVEEDLALKHRKERKELQGKILSLKKSSAKSDKKKKKEVLEEIARLEFELDNRQSEELLNVISQTTNTLSLENEEATDDVKEQSSTQRVSKAQKRRDKKTIKCKERDQQILVQDAENIHGPRNLETQSIKKILKERQLMIHEIPSDGNCLYCAVDHQWQLVHGSSHGLQRLRTLTAAHLRDNMADLLPFMTDPVTGDGLSEVQFEAYCVETETTPAWGGEVELRALSEVLRCPIEVVQAAGPSVRVGTATEGCPALTLTYHRHMYGLGAHYNAVQPYVEEESPE